MAFFEARLDERIERGATGGPTNPGRVKLYKPDGRLTQKFAASLPIHRYSVSHGLRTPDGQEAVLAMFYVVNFTPYTGFRFKAWWDYTATQTNSVATLISGSNYQLQRVYTVGAVSFNRPIYKPVSGTVQVYRTRSAVVSAATATIDYTTGVATISGHVSGDTYTWTGEFDVPVTFVNNEWTESSLEVSTSNLFVRAQPVELEEIRL